jgi:hypothetical protein
VDENVLTTLPAAIASVPAVDCTFVTTGWFGSAVSMTTSNRT